jgi:hypothetical protein
MEVNLQKSKKASATLKGHFTLCLFASFAVCALPLHSWTYGLDQGFVTMRDREERAGKYSQI